ncbi:hypothetical protein RF11_07957 [Thelohanellus kitauei]|uniref:Uncharacterized protein n=1 Tax=Thelohanellus kitauei TaxID=669202 RepID=A0A0C2MMF4_THEKT|nr:hypothetical protein RF11_07957 [Thelohanellus kitauei]
MAFCGPSRILDVNPPAANVDLSESWSINLILSFTPVQPSNTGNLLAPIIRIWLKELRCCGGRETFRHYCRRHSIERTSEAPTGMEFANDEQMISAKVPIELQPDELRKA